MWTIALTVLTTLVVVLIVINLHTPEKEIRHQVDHCHDIADPRFRREMGALLGPAIVGGNRIEALQNGAEIFPSMLAAISAARHSITFETYIYWSGDTGTRFIRTSWLRASAGH